MLPPFHGERMRSYETAMDGDRRPRDRLLAAAPEFPIHPRMQAVTLEVILRVVFGVADGPAPGAPARGCSRTSCRKPPRRAPSWSAWRRGASAAAGRGPFEGQLKEADELLYAEIAEHRAAADLEEREDILSMLMLAGFEDGGGMSDTELRDQLMTLLLAGHETTATALAWTFDLLLRHPAALPRLRDSLEAGRTTTCGRRSPSRCACARSCRWPGAASPSRARRPTA